jgi:ABC-type transport system substrate-binding protein
MPHHDESLDEVLQDYIAERTDRRGFLKRAGALGLSAGAAAGVLSTYSSIARAAAATLRTPAAAREQVKRGGTLIEGYDRDFTKMDSVQSGWADPGYYALYEFVQCRDPNGRVVPDMAQYVHISPDGKTWTIKIRDGLKFQSGAPCTAVEVAANFNVFKDPSIGQNAIFWPPMTITAEPGNIVKIALQKPDSALSLTIATEYSMIENLATRKKVGSSYGASTTDGTGPFTLTEFTPGNRVRVSRWSKYPGTGIPFLSNKGPAYLDEVEWIALVDPSTRADALIAGTCHALSNPAPQDVDRLKSESNLVVQEWPAPANNFMSPNWALSSLGFNDIRVRQAISHAIDREAIAKAVFFGHAEPTYGPVPTNYLYYEPGVEKFNQYNPGLSIKLLKQAGWTLDKGVFTKNGKPLAFTHLDWAAQAYGHLIMDAIVPMLADVGIKMTVESLQSAQFFPAYPKSQSFGYEWLWASPIDVLVIFAVIPSPAYNGNLPDLAAAFNAWKTASSNAQLKAAASKAQLIWAEKLPKIPIVTRNQVWAHDQTVHNWQPSQTHLYPFYNDVWVD